MKTRNGSRRLLYSVIAVTAAVSLGLVGCTSDDELDSGGDSTASTVDTDTSTGDDAAADQTTTSDASTDDNASDATDDTIDPYRAIEIAVAESPGAAVVEIERDTSDGVQVWELDLLAADGSGLEMKIALDDGRIIEQKATNLDQEKQTVPTVSAADIITKALDAHPGDLLGAEIDTEHGVVVWEVKIRTTDGAQVKTYFDPATGDVVQP